MAFSPQFPPNPPTPPNTLKNPQKTNFNVNFASHKSLKQTNHPKPFQVILQYKARKKGLQKVKYIIMGGDFDAKTGGFN